MSAASTRACNPLFNSPLESSFCSPFKKGDSGGNKCSLWGNRKPKPFTVSLSFRLNEVNGEISDSRPLPAAFGCEISKCVRRVRAKQQRRMPSYLIYPSVTLRVPPPLCKGRQVVAPYRQRNLVPQTHEKFRATACTEFL